MFNFILGMTGGAEGGGKGMDWIPLVILGVLMVGMILMSIIPQKKRQKQAQEMMSALKKGDKIKTIGGFVGKIVAIDDGNNTLDIDVSAKDDAPVIVTIDKSAIYTVMNPVPQQNYDEAKTVEAKDGSSVVTADDLEEDKKAAEKKAEKANKKNNKKAEDEIFEDSKDAEVAPEADAKTDEVKVDEADNK